MKLKKKHIFIIGCISVLVIITAVFSAKTGDNTAPGMLGTILSPIQKGASVLVNGTEAFIRDVISSGKNAQENQMLKEEKLALESQVRMLEGYKTENEKLRKLLELKESRTELRTTSANVIGRETDEIHSTLIIDKGTKDGVMKNSVVFVSEGLVGTVCETAHNYSKVKTIFDKESFVSAICPRSGDMGVIESTGSSLQNAMCSMKYLDKSAKTIVGDIVETSGTGGVFPEGLLIGKITEIKEDNRSLTLVANIETGININRLDKVLVTVK